MSTKRSPVIPLLAIALSIFALAWPEPQAFAEPTAMELQADIDSQHQANVESGEDWTQKKGMLGLGLFGSLVATLSLYVFIAVFIIGGINSHKATGKFWSHLNKRLIFEIGRATGILNKSLVGIPTPRMYVDSSDGKYKAVPESMFKEAYSQACHLMNAQNWSYKGDNPTYKYRVLDCEDFAMKMKAEMTKYLADTYGDYFKGHGIPITLFGYTRDSDGKGHVVVKTLIREMNVADECIVFVEPYAERFGIDTNLSETEVASNNLHYT